MVEDSWLLRHNIVLSVHRKKEEEEMKNDEFERERMRMQMERATLWTLQHQQSLHVIQISTNTQIN